MVGQDSGPSLGAFTLSNGVAAVGRSSIYTGILFAVIGFAAAVYTNSLGPTPDLPAALLLLLCPAAVFESMTSTSPPDTDFMWLIAILNAIVYGALGAFLGRLFHVDEE